MLLNLARHLIDSSAILVTTLLAFLSVVSAVSLESHRSRVSHSGRACWRRGIGTLDQYVMAQR